MSETTTTATETDANRNSKTETANSLADQTAVNAMVVSGDNWWDDTQKFALIQRAAIMFSSSPLVPETYQGKSGVGSCVIALNMAHRMNADPLMVMQNLYIVYGRPAWSAQFLIACFNQTKRFEPIRYRWSGQEGRDDWGCTAFSKDIKSGEIIEGPLVTIDTAKKEGWYSKKGSKWTTIPRLMLMYRAAAWLVRTHAPELTMGLQTAEEAHDMDRPDFAAAPTNVIESLAAPSRTEAALSRIQQATQAQSQREPGDEPAETTASKKTAPKGQKSLMSTDDLMSQCEAVRTFPDVEAARRRVTEASIDDDERRQLTLILDKHQRRLQAEQGD